MTEKPTPTPPEIRQLKAQIWQCWEQLPPEHQATITLVMAQTVALHGAYGGWLLDAWSLLVGENPDE